MTATRLSFWLMGAASLLVALGSWRFLVLGLDPAFPEFAAHLAARRTAFALHVVFAPVALALGVAQLWPGLRARWPAWHRRAGRVYAASVLLGAVSALVLARAAPGGPVAGAGFAALAVLWLATTGLALRHALGRRVAAHRAWMIRSFALTFSAVTLRIYLAGFLLAGTGYAEASVWLAWICWVPNLLFAEWWIARGSRPGTAAVAAR